LLGAQSPQSGRGFAKAQKSHSAKRHEISGLADTIIIGLGAMGSAVAFHLARRGRKVLGLDRFAPPHAFGSSHGRTRIIREAYFEHPAYVPLVQRAYELWAELEREAGARLFQPTGGLMIGRPDGTVAGGARRSAETHQLQYESFSAAEVRRRYPALAPAEDMVAIWEPRAGILFPEKCIEAHLAGARRFGAELHFDEPVLDWKAEGEGVRVVTAQGNYQAGQLVIAAGSWTEGLLPGSDLAVSIERQVQFWFEPLRRRELFSPERCPVHLWEYETGRFFYGFPDLGEGVKVAIHHQGQATTPETLDREIRDADVEAMRQMVRRHLPDADGKLRSAAVCMYTNTADGHFLIDRHPAHPQVVVASPCSGHGFKFSSAVGEVLADLVEGKKPRCELALFRWR
jgi:sarcosine oxidase